MGFNSGFKGLKNMMVRKLLRSNREEVKDTGKNCIIRSFMILTSHYYLHDHIKKNGMGGLHMWKR